MVSLMRRMTTQRSFEVLAQLPRGRGHTTDGIHIPMPRATGRWKTNKTQPPPFADSPPESCQEVARLEGLGSRVLPSSTPFSSNGTEPCGFQMGPTPACDFLDRIDIVRSTASARGEGGGARPAARRDLVLRVHGPLHLAVDLTVRPRDEDGLRCASIPRGRGGSSVRLYSVWMRACVYAYA